MLITDFAIKNLDIDDQLRHYVGRLFSLLTSYKVVLKKNREKYTDFDIKTDVISTIVTGRWMDSKDTFQLIEQCVPVFQQLFEQNKITFYIRATELVENDRILFHVREY